MQKFTTTEKWDSGTRLWKWSQGS